MRIETIQNLVIGINQKDYELISFCENKGFKITYRRKKNNTYWNIALDGFIEFKLVSTKLAGEDYLNLPKEGVLFEVLDSPWIDEFERVTVRNLDSFKHFILKFTNYIIEFISRQLIFDN
jgi:hypothetical protein